jgi:transcription elongation factor GreA
MSDHVVLTPEAFAALQAEIADLEGRARREIAERIKAARELGDLSENAEYHDAKNDQAHLETRILRLREIERSAQVREAQTGGETVGFGSRVRVRDEASGRETTYTLVSSTEARPAEGRIAADSPIARALAGARAGSTVRFAAPRGERTLVVLAVE